MFCARVYLSGNAFESSEICTATGVSASQPEEAGYKTPPSGEFFWGPDTALRGCAKRAEEARGKPSQSHIPPSISRCTKTNRFKLQV